MFSLKNIFHCHKEVVTNKRSIYLHFKNNFVNFKSPAIETTFFCLKCSRTRKQYNTGYTIYSEKQFNKLIEKT